MSDTCKLKPLQSCGQESNETFQQQLPQESNETFQQQPPQDASGVQSELGKLSKRQLKKLTKKQNYLSVRILKRKLEKERRKIKRRELMQQLAASGEPRIQNRQPKTKLMSHSDNKFRIVIDLDFEDYMTDSEISQSARQVNLIYGLNRRSDNPCQLYVSSFKGSRLLPIFDQVNKGYASWDVHMSDKHYLDLFIDSDAKTSEQLKTQMIYLTGDTDETLPSVDELLKDETKIFIIGGLVDHNRHKNLCYRLATDSNIKTARLPIKENNIRLCQRHIFSTVTVFEIMLNVLSSRKQWREAFLSSIPQRKLAQSNKSVDDVKNKEENDIADNPISTQQLNSEEVSVLDDKVVLGAC